jgi:hypothetical protein
MTRGSGLTQRICNEQRKPCCVVDLASVVDEMAAELLREFTENHKAASLNVAGCRESTAPGIQARVREIVAAALGAD